MKIVGLMSGTSYDGVDVAAAEFEVEGDTLWLRPLGHRELNYDDELRAEICALLRGVRVRPAGLALLAPAARCAAVGDRGHPGRRARLLDPGRAGPRRRPAHPAAPAADPVLSWRSARRWGPGGLGPGCGVPDGR